MTSTTTQAPAEQLRQLAALAANLRWTWHGPTRELFETLGRRLGRATTSSAGVDEMLLRRLTALARSRRVAAKISELTVDLHDYLDDARWYQLAREVNPDMPAGIAYFSADFDIVGLLGNDSDPLGAIAGDQLKAASDLGVPLVAVGLDYRDDSLPGAATAHPLVPHLLAGLGDRTVRQRLTDRQGRPALVFVDLPGGRTLWSQIWRIAVGRVDLLLLDTDIENNECDLRSISQRHSRSGDVRRRLHQDLLLGVGGPQAIHVWCAHGGHEYPSVFHCNGERTAFVGLERVRELLDNRVVIGDAITSVRMTTIFTSHVSNPIESGYYRDGMLRKHLNTALLDEVPLDMIRELDASRMSGVLNPTDLGLGLAMRSTRVRMSSNAAHGYWPSRNIDHVPDEVVQPGVHGPSWEASEISRLVTMTGWEGIDLIPDRPALADQHLWRWHCTLRGRLVRAVQDWLREEQLRRGAATRRLRWISGVLTADGLTIGLACGAHNYQGLGLLLWHPEWLRSLVLDDDRPVQLVVVVPAGQDATEPAFLDKVQWLREDVEFRRRIVFVPADEPSLNRLVYAGCDVWLNEPTDGRGHSVFGMRAVLNGALSIYFHDGWPPIGSTEETGWTVPGPTVHDAGDNQLDQQAFALFNVLAQHAIPTFYESGDGGLPTRWIEMVRRTLLVERPRLQASRMVADYVENYYIPAGRARTPNG
jgi:starch phosphorylase